MSILELTRWQWQGYPDYHRQRTNLLIHIVAVPLFQLGSLGLGAALMLGMWPASLGGLGLMGLALALQGRGHRLEHTPPAPFSSPFNAVGRLLLEQWVNFPRFVLSGGFSRALREAERATSSAP